ncbi:PadR family transcriptional regulator [Evansella clarkii]|uniref:PadR family transcriptional regulator n=1 Tax=Evansella clarkii TaxID=79879 RepID=UPI001FD1C4F8|nr:PadR family transcriptional regulator [Evansella clarkii]
MKETTMEAVDLDVNKMMKAYLPMTETAYYILLSLNKPRHEYGIVKHVEKLTNERIRLRSGTVYGTLTKMQRDGVMTVYADEQRITNYQNRRENSLFKRVKGGAQG